MSPFCRHTARTIVTTSLLLALATCVSAQEAETPAKPAPPTAQPELASPRATLATFLRTVRDKETDAAVECIDTSGMTPDAIRNGGPSLVYQLKVAIDRRVGIDLPEDGELLEGEFAEAWRAVSDENDLPQPFTLDKIPGASPEARVLVLRRNPEDANWRFSRETREAVEALYEEIEQQAGGDTEVADADVPLTIRLRNLFPAALRKTRLVLPDYQWLCLLVLIFVGLIADLLARGVLTLIGNRGLQWFIAVPSDEAGDAQGVDPAEAETPSTAPVWRPMGRLVNAAVWYYGATVIGLPTAALSVLLAVLQLFTIVAAAWSAFTVIDLLAAYLSRQAKKTSTKFDDLVVPLATRTLKLFTVAVGVLTAAQAFGLPLLGLVGGLGLGGAALALASKDAVANFFGSVTVLFDRPFEVGDWIVTDGAEGTVESVGFRSTRIRTFYNSLITLPNSHLTTAVVDNMGRRRYRRIKTTLSLEYGTTPEQLDAFCEGVRELIRRHPHTRKDSFHVYFNDFGASSLDVMLYCFLACTDWGMELQERHRLLADILRLASRLGVQFAFPTRTLHVTSSDGAFGTGTPLGEATVGGAAAREAGREAAEEVFSARPPKT